VTNVKSCSDAVGSFGALVEAVIGFVGGNLEDVVRQDLRTRGMTARESEVRAGSSLRRGLRSTSSYSAKIAGVPEKGLVLDANI